MDTALNALDYLLSANESAYNHGEYDRAYHKLAAAVHVAQAMRNSASLLQISKRAREQQFFIDAKEPTYRHSSQSAAKRGRKGLFENLSFQALLASRIYEVANSL